jgi:Zn-dependent M28 family amino/carboxypeptidase
MSIARIGLTLCLLSGIASAAPRKNIVADRETAAVAKIDEHALTAHIRFLSDDLLEGRAPASAGDEIAMRYVAAEMERLGLQPLGDTKDGVRSYIQRLPLVGLRGRVVTPPVIHGKLGDLHLKPEDDAVLVSGVQKPNARLKDAPLVFVGFGIVAPEEQWDDYAGLDVHGKVVVILNNDPSTDPKRFGGTTRLYYGRWDYKYMEAARHGAAGAIIIHTTPSAGYPWQVVQTSWSRTAFELPAADEPRLQMRMWVTEARARDILRLAGVSESLDALSARAELPGFHALPLDAKMSAELAVEVERVETGNVLGLVPGTDPKVADEYLVVTAHHDHLGRRHIDQAAAPTTKGGHADHDDIYNGALDNASGVGAVLELATALADSHPRRGILFAVVAAEESGLLGSAWLCAHLPVPAGKLAANLNIDGINIWGRTHDITFIGLGKSSLDEVVRKVAAEQGRVVTTDQFPDRGSFYRSDQLNFARIGVPAIYLSTGTEFPGHDQAWGRARVDEYVKSRYHQPSDELDASWKLDGAIEDLRLEGRSLLRVANGSTLPTWRAGDEFEAARKKAREELETMRK